MKQAETGLDDPLESDIAFHLSILEASDNRFFMQLGRIIDTTLRVSIRFTNMRTGVRAGNHGEHKMIYDAIVSKNPALASQSAKNLMDSALGTIVAALKEQR